ncbi:MAG: lipoyl synthase [Lentisphaeria bacterium]
MSENLPENKTTSSIRLEHPEWYKVPFQGGRERIAMRSLLRNSHLHTVCESARCPNLCDCWKRQTATFMILGDTCTRNCRFCAVNHGQPLLPDADEPARIAEGIATLKLRFAVITCVTRDDLPDGGAALMAETIRAIHQRCPETKVEVLCSDYAGSLPALHCVLDAAPEVFGHNLETVERLTPLIRNKANYRRSLEVLSRAAVWAANHNRQPRIKSGLMLGLGENDEEIRQALADLRQSGVQVITIGQYLQPGKENWPVARHVSPEEFKNWACVAEQDFGFRKAVCGPLIRSSYLAEEAYLA